MRAIILAAGRGSRMKSLTDNHPKCFTKIKNKKLIEWQMEALKDAGVEKISIVRGYQSHLFTYDVTYFDNKKWARTNMLSSLVEAAQWLRDDSCIVSYSDIVYSPRSVERLASAEGNIMITYDPNWLNLWSLRFDDPLSDAETFKLNADSELVEIGGKAESVSQIEGQFMGLLRFTPVGWKIIESYLSGIEQEVLDKMDMTSLLKELILSGVKIKAIKIDEPWYEVDSENDLTEYLKNDNFKL